MVNFKKAGAALLLAGTIGTVGMAPASAYSTSDCYWRVSDIMPFRTLHEEVCYIDFSWAEEQLFPRSKDGDKVMTSYIKFSPQVGNHVVYDYQDTWWPGPDKDA